VAKVTPRGGEIEVEAEDILGGGKMRVTADMVVLATGMEPASTIPGVVYDENSFVVPGAGAAQALGAGCAKKPVDVAVAVQDATGVALKAIQAMVRS
jgi:quinone-modifying oxidoreductase subunit QmoA